MSKLWTMWMMALGSYSDDKTQDYDTAITIIRTLIVLVNLCCALLIMANILHKW